MLQSNVSLEGETVLVTGAAGFIGANLVKRLFSDIQDIKVIGIDSITDYYDVNIKYERLKEIEGLKRDWVFIKGSIADKELVEKIPTALEMGKVYQRLISDTLVPEEDYVDGIIRVYNNEICDTIDNYNCSAFYEPSYVIARAYQNGGF